MKCFFGTVCNVDEDALGGHDDLVFPLLAPGVQEMSAQDHPDQSLTLGGGLHSSVFLVLFQLGILGLSLIHI